MRPDVTPDNGGRGSEPELPGGEGLEILPQLCPLATRRSDVPDRFPNGAHLGARRMKPASHAGLLIEPEWPLFKPANDPVLSRR